MQKDLKPYLLKRNFYFEMEGVCHKNGIILKNLPWSSNRKSTTAKCRFGGIRLIKGSTRGMLMMGHKNFYVWEFNVWPNLVTMSFVNLEWKRMMTCGRCNVSALPREGEGGDSLLSASTLVGCSSCRCGSFHGFSWCLSGGLLGGWKVKQLVGG